MQEPFSKDFGLIRQIQRAAVSICSNIAEEAERESSKDSAHFYTIVKRSAAEVAAQLEIASEIELIGKNDFRMWSQETEPIARTLNSLIKSVKTRGSKQ